MNPIVRSRVGSYLRVTFRLSVGSRQVAGNMSLCQFALGAGKRVYPPPERVAGRLLSQASRSQGVFFASGGRQFRSRSVLLSLVVGSVRFPRSQSRGRAYAFLASWKLGVIPPWHCILAQALSMLWPDQGGSVKQPSSVLGYWSLPLVSQWCGNFLS